MIIYNKVKPIYLRFEIPGIVGAKIATKVLKDGDLVEVDADEGVVKILKEQ